MPSAIGLGQRFVALLICRFGWYNRADIDYRNTFQGSVSLDGAVKVHSFTCNGAVDKTSSGLSSCPKSVSYIEDQAYSSHKRSMSHHRKYSVN